MNVDAFTPSQSLCPPQLITATLPTTAAATATAAMNKQVAADLIAVLSRSTDKTLIHKCLLKIRHDLVGRDRAGIELFHRLNGIPPLVRLISKPYEKIIDVALSILANCCVSRPCCKQAIEHGVVPPLLSILRSIPSVSVQCRACRLLGNLARASNEKICGLARGIGVAIAALLADTRDVNTLNMAVRAARLLWNEMPFYDEFVRHGGVQKILQILVAQATRHPVAGPPAPDHMHIHVRNIQFMEVDDSRVFDREIMKKEPVRTDADRFGYPDAGQPHAKDVRELIGELMRSLQALTGRQSYRIVHDVLAVEHGCQCIVSFARPDSPLRGVALRILASLAKGVPAADEHLSRADAITAACRLITHAGLEPALSETEERHCIAVICALASSACNRAKIRISGAFTRIMEIAKQTKCDTVLKSILMGLKHFQYDLISIDQMIGVGLVSVLVERLDRLTGDMSAQHEPEAVKRQPEEPADADADAADDGEAQPPAESDNDSDGPASTKRPRFESSPPGSSSGGGGGGGFYSHPSSPCSSAGRSPERDAEPAAAAADTGDMDSEYSPVCSDMEDEDGRSGPGARKHPDCGGSDQSPEVLRLLDVAPVSAAAAEAAADDSLDSPDDDADSDTSKTDASAASGASEAAAKMATVTLITETLGMISFRLKYASDLCTAPILSTLVRICRLVSRPAGPRWNGHGAPLVLATIAEETRNFVPIIKQSLVFQIYAMTQVAAAHADCGRCADVRAIGDGLLAKLCAVGEMGYGRGEMALLLLRGDRRTHTHVAIVTMYIIRQPRFLHTLLVEHGALYTVMECILSKQPTAAAAAADDGEELAAHAANGLTALSRTLGICEPACQTDQLQLAPGDLDLMAAACADDADADADADSTIYFVAGDGAERVAFDRDTLIGYSDVFATMLRNNFRESHERQIRLPKQTAAGVRYFLDCLRALSGDGERRVRVPAAGHVGAVLQTYDMAQVYLMPVMEAAVFNVLLRLLAPETVLPMFEFAMREHKTQLADVAVAYYLRCEAPGATKVEMYRAADDAEFYKEWSQMMLDAVVYTCHSQMIK